MLTRPLLTLCALLLAGTARAAEPPVTYNPYEGPVCLIAGLPPAQLQYQVLGKIKQGKDGYGEIEDVIPGLANQARAMGAHAVIQYSASQRFGLWPWRFVYPFVRGTAVRWSQPPPDCAAMGGQLH